MTADLPPEAVEAAVSKVMAIEPFGPWWANGLGEREDAEECVRTILAAAVPHLQRQWEIEQINGWQTVEVDNA